MDRWLPPYHGGSTAVGLLAIRLVAGSALMFHGWPKIQNPFSWLGPGVPGIFQAAAAVAEFGGGLCWILGALTPLASLLILCTMAYAAIMVHIMAGHPFVSPGGRSYELAAVYFVVALLLLLAGPGKIAIDYLLYLLIKRPEPTSKPAGKLY